MKEDINKYSFKLQKKIFLILSFLFHILLLQKEYVLIDDMNPSLLEKKNQKVKFSFKKNTKKIKPKQIVSTNENNKKIIKRADFFSKKNNSFSKQTRAQNLNFFNKGGYGNSKISSPLKQKSKISKKKSTSKKQHKKLKALKKISLKDFALENTTFKKKNNILRKKGNKKNSKKNKGVESSNDYLKNISIGSVTQLNTKENKYYGFYFRIKQKLEQYWNKSLKEKINEFRNSNKRVPASSEYLTSLEVVLGKKGEIIKGSIIESSGIKEFDEAALESFYKAGPFPNPPKGMLKGNQISIRWGFVIKNN